MAPVLQPSSNKEPRSCISLTYATGELSKGLTENQVNTANWHACITNISQRIHCGSDIVNTCAFSKSTAGRRVRWYQTNSRDTAEDRVPLELLNDGGRDVLPALFQANDKLGYQPTRPNSYVSKRSWRWKNIYHYHSPTVTKTWPTRTSSQSFNSWWSWSSCWKHITRTVFLGTVTHCARSLVVDNFTPEPERLSGLIEGRTTEATYLAWGFLRHWVGSPKCHSWRQRVWYSVPRAHRWFSRQ